MNRFQQKSSATKTAPKTSTVLTVDFKSGEVIKSVETNNSTGEVVSSFEQIKKSKLSMAIDFIRRYTA